MKKSERIDWFKEARFGCLFTGERLFIQGLPKKAPDPIDTVIVLKLAEEC